MLTREMIDQGLLGRALVTRGGIKAFIRYKEPISQAQTLPVSAKPFLDKISVIAAVRVVLP